MDIRARIQSIVKLAQSCHDLPDDQKVKHCNAIKTLCYSLIEELEDYHIIKKTRCGCEDK